ncbi:hypothetical protein CIHG_04729 [Coccidioides immitis H538.4]|uniref:Uncharacterized protein n=1 Tax=Coccidioides immitis H538.4 TaxID=396776 RepID=A0A0J8RTK3_COCIT|nr:hypothetical protein CIHG_04729 [Coccidioides immitis H538.4]
MLEKERHNMLLSELQVPASKHHQKDSPTKDSHYREPIQSSKREISCKYIAFEAFIINRPFGHLRMAANILGRNGEAPASAEGQKDGEHDAAMEEEKLIGTIAWRASQPRRTGRCGAWAVRSVVRGDSVSDKGAGFGRQNGSDSAS